MRNSCTSQGVVYGIFAFSSFLFDSLFDGCATWCNRRKLFEIKLTCRERRCFAVFLTLKRRPLERHLYYNAFLVQMSCTPVASETKSKPCLFCVCCCWVHKKASKQHRNCTTARSKWNLTRRSWQLPPAADHWKWRETVTPIVWREMRLSTSLRSIFSFIVPSPILLIIFCNLSFLGVGRRGKGNH